MSSRPDLELALDVRSDEKVVVIADQDSTYQYPDSWVRPNRADLQIDALSIVVVDRVELQRRTLSLIGEANPRLVAFAVASVDHEKQVRRMVTSLYPWNEVWTVFTSFGKLLVTPSVRGLPYDRETIEDQRAA